MAAYSQANRPLSVTTPLGKDVLLLVGIHGREAISQLFEFQLELLAKKDATIAFDRILGQTVTVEMPQPEGGKRYFNGIIRRFEQGGRDADFAHFRAVLSPQFWLWTKKVQSRIFQHLKVPDILKQVLDGLKVDIQTKGAYQPRDYCVQYRESDFAFASRLMEEEGIHYYFEHTADSHKLVISDDPSHHPDVAGPSSVIYEEVEGGTREGHRVSQWSKAQEMTVGKYTLWDHHFELTGQNLESKEQILTSVTAGKVDHKLTVGGNDKLEIYDYPGAFAQRFDGIDKSGGPQPAELKKVFDDGKRTAKIRMEQEAAASLEIRGASSCSQFVAGHRFSLTRHFDADGKYLLLGVEHTARLGDGYRSGREPTYEYENRFTAVPIALPYRPPRTTPKPTISGTQTATVVGLPGQDIFLDPYGRVKVQFPWDRQGKRNADSSCWVRVAQIWAGNTWGAFFWPRVGHEVVVAFEEGDPDRPLVVGSVYNNANLPPYPLPITGALAGIKSCTVKGKPARDFNQIMFNDEADDEYLQLHSEKHVALHNEDSTHEFIPGNHIQVLGNLLLPTGSGGGGGVLTQMLSAVPGVSGALPAMKGSYSYVFGDQVTSVSDCLMPANRLAWIYGTDMRCVVDPLSWLLTAVPTVVSPCLGANGSLAAILGNNQTLSYGINTSIQRGPVVAYKTNDVFYLGGTPDETISNAAIYAAAGLASMLGLALTLKAYQKQAPSAVTKTETDDKGKTFTASIAQKDTYQTSRNDLGTATNFLIAMAWGLVVWLEQAISRVQPATRLSAEAAKLLVQGPMNPQYSEPHLTHASEQVKDSMTLLAQAAMSANALAAQAKTQKATHVDVYDTDYALIAPDIAMIAIRKPTDPAASNILIDAQGGLTDAGNVFINASKEVAVACGPTRLMQESEAMGQSGKITITTGLTPLGEIQINNGQPGIPGSASILMTPSALSIHFGAIGVGPTITLNDLGIMMQVGPFQASLGPSGWNCPSNVPEMH